MSGKYEETKEPYTPEITKALVLSTGHITENDQKILTKGDLWFSHSTERGWIISGLSPDDEYDKLFFDNEIVRAELSSAFLWCCNNARTNGCSRLELDGDGPINPVLPVFDW